MTYFEEYFFQNDRIFIVDDKLGEIDLCAEVRITETKTTQKKSSKPLFPIGICNL